MASLVGIKQLQLFGAAGLLLFLLLWVSQSPLVTSIPLRGRHTLWNCVA